MENARVQLLQLNASCDESNTRYCADALMYTEQFSILSLGAVRIGSVAYQSFCCPSSDGVHGGGSEQVHGLLHMALCDIHLELHACQGLADAHNCFQLSYCDGHGWHFAATFRCTCPHL